MTQPGQRYLAQCICRAGLLAIASTLSCMAGTCQGSDAAESEYRPGPDFLYNVARFTSWPGATGQQFNLCIMGNSRFSNLTDTLASKRVHGKPLQVSYPASPEHATHCQMLYISPSHAEHLEYIIAALQGHAILTLSDIDDFTGRGGIIGMYTVDSKLHFDVNIGSATEAGLSISSRVLQLANVIRTDR